MTAEKNLGDYLYEKWGHCKGSFKQAWILDDIRLKISDLWKLKSVLYGGSWCIKYYNYRINQFLQINFTRLNCQVFQHLVIDRFIGDEKPELTLVPQEKRDEVWLPLHAFDFSPSGKNGCILTQTYMDVLVVLLCCCVVVTHVMGLPKPLTI